MILSRVVSAASVPTQQLFVRDDVPRVDHQQLEELVLRRGQHHRIAPDENGPVRKIEAELAGLGDDRAVVGHQTFERIADLHQQLPGVELRP